MTSDRRQVEPGRSPNAFVGQLSTEVRCHWTPYTPFAEVEQAILETAIRAVAEARAQHELWSVGVSADEER